jgi:hypothetical protein
MDRGFRRETRLPSRSAIRLGSGRILNTPGLYLLCIRSGLITVEEADAAKATLEQRRFRMVFASFRDLL